MKEIRIISQVVQDLADRSQNTNEIASRHDQYNTSQSVSINISLLPIQYCFYFKEFRLIVVSHFKNFNTLSGFSRFGFV